MVKIECIGYAFEQCYTSNIAIVRKDDTPTECLKELQSIVESYEEALEVLEVEESSLVWSISTDIRKKVLQATTLEEAY